MCPHCSKTFTQSITLKIHVRLHTRENSVRVRILRPRVHSILQSDGAPANPTQPDNGIGREVDVLPEYKCRVCSKVYRSAKSFRLHEKLHATGKLFDCRDCGKKYNTYVSKCKASNTDVKEKMYSCKIYSQTFKHQQSGVYHMSNKTKHKRFDRGFERSGDGRRRSDLAKLK
ncbi:zinc finger protein 14-like [Topomyia yanbarensis]|uniref:zinc finger protein 14-like n=1 Tax=Topomyia yanbarensis TaxID=2498891 RepID=UPI00273BAA4E|nr:zinc finger protein 14-like [Topomyia yanbarensis]